MPEPTEPRVYSTGFTTRAVARHSWPADCFIQGGDNGIVFQGGSIEEALTDTGKAVEAIAAGLGLANPPGSYRTAFFEAFPKNPASFLRGEGNTLDDAEDDCWRAWQRILACPGHEFERRGYRAGAGICRHCGLFHSSAFTTTLDPCVTCGEDGANTGGGPDLHGKWRCKKCYPLIPEDDKSDLHKRFDRMRLS